MKAKLFLISAASGTGKSSLINAVLDNLNSKNFNVELSISHTTRKKGAAVKIIIFLLAKMILKIKLVMISF